jgi:hypothetical protein
MMLFLLLLLAHYVQIGSYKYRIDYSGNTLGSTNYPIDDKLGDRYIVLPTMKGQQPISWMHESIHACFHDHPHEYKSKEELQMHLSETMYTEEEVATLLAPCLLELEKKK